MFYIWFKCHPLKSIIRTPSFKRWTYWITEDMRKDTKMREKYVRNTNVFLTIACAIIWQLTVNRSNSLRIIFINYIDNVVLAYESI